MIIRVSKQLSDTNWSDSAYVGREKVSEILLLGGEKSVKFYILKVCGQPPVR